jgi:hypothetical protein
VQGFVKVPGQGFAYYRAPWKALVYIGGAEWAPPRDAEET